VRLTQPLRLLLLVNAELHSVAYDRNVRLPDALTERLPFLGALEEPWERNSIVGLGAWLAFYGLFIFQLARGRGVLPMIDLVFVPIHEGGHLLFRWFGHTMMLLGGTFLQLFVPAALGVYFVFRRQVRGTAFCLFCFFEQFLPIATYMADARAQELPLLTVGDPEFVEHDWFAIFHMTGLLGHDTQVAAVMRGCGWAGMSAVVGWLVWRTVQAARAQEKPQVR
jgi:hypothetical protein